MAEIIRLGLLQLSDAAPVVLARDLDIFTAHGLKVELHVEPSWANVADKLGYGLLDGAVMLPPLALACALGLRGRKTELVVPMSLSANGNAITFSNAWKNAFEGGGQDLRAVIAARHARPRLAVVHGFSTHDLLLRYWLAASGIDPDRDVELTVLPPAEMVGSLAAGAIDGFCAGAPWGQVATHARLGFIAVQSRDIWRDHPEKCLSVRSDFAVQDPGRHLALLTALGEAAALCADPIRRGDLAGLLARPDYLDLPAELIAQSLDTEEGGPKFDQNYPEPSHATWFARQLIRWGKAPESVLPVSQTLYRPELYISAGGTRPVLPRVEQFFDQASAA
jgi:NitT/TauT family transport system ATP-binding protein/nitrate/nitrite transport system substrate-binding protein